MHHIIVVMYWLYMPLYHCMIMSHLGEWVDGGVVRGTKELFNGGRVGKGESSEAAVCVWMCLCRERERGGHLIT